MSYLKFSPNLFLESIELNRFKRFVDDDGFRKNILENSVNFGLIKSNLDITFPNGLVQPDADVISGGLTFKSIKYNEIFAIDAYGSFLHGAAGRQLAIPDDSNWHWIRISYQNDIIEPGTFSISADGTLTGTNAALLSTLRGQPNFPSRVRFPNATLNTGEYDMLEIVNDNLAIMNDVSFQQEDNLQLAVVGTFTPGTSVPSGDKYIFQYDSCLVELVPEAIQNSRPTNGFVQGRHFYTARVKVSGADLIIQDKRVDYWETKGSDLSISIERGINPAIGVETIRFLSPLTPQDHNQVDVYWGMRTANWSIDSSRNVLTLISALGGRYKSVNDFIDGDFNGWRAYTANGKYSRITNSVKQGSAINLTLDVLDVDNYSSDGGQTFYSTLGDFVTVVPNAEEIELLFVPNPLDNVPSMSRVFTFPINALIGQCEVAVYQTDNTIYNLQYRYKSFKEYSEYKTITLDPIGFYNENQFDINGNLISSPVRTPYNTNPVTGDGTEIGFLPLQLASSAYGRFVNRVYKGDLIGVQENPNMASIATPLKLTVGTSKQYQHFTGNITLTHDLVIILVQDGATEGNKFVIHFEMSQLNLAGFNLTIVEGLGSGQTVLKTITQGDIYQMMNQDNGLVFDCNFSMSGNWLISQNYTLGVPNETKILTRTDALANFSSNLGSVKGYFGWGVANGATYNGVPTTDLREMFLVGMNPSNGEYFPIGTPGGIDMVSLTSDQNGPHTHPLGQQLSAYGTHDGNTDPERAFIRGGDATGSSGLGLPHENRPPYYTVLYIQKLY